MATGRIYNISVAPPPTFKGRIYKVSVTGTATGGGKGRIYQVNVTGTAPVTGKGRIYKVSAAGTASVRVVLPTAPVTVLGPGETTTVTAALADGTAADSWSWTQVSGAAVTLTGSGASRTFAGPSVMPPEDTVVISVTATKGGETSPPVQFSITILPQTVWTYDGVGWVGGLVAPA